MASRILSRRRLLPFVKRMNARYDAGWVHEDICRRLEKFSDDVAAGLSPRLMLLVPPRHGKLLADTTPVMTTRGWTTHGELVPGDRVFGPDGKPTKVVAVSPVDLATFEVRTTNGAVLKAHGAHEWAVFDRSRRAWRTVETRELAAQELRTGPVGKRGGCYRFQLPLRQALVLPEAELLADPYLLGVWLGNGNSDDGSFCFAETDRGVYKAAVNCGYVPSWSTVHAGTKVNYVGSRAFTATLRTLGVLRNKHVPSAYMYSSIEQRLALLAGMVDTDGHVEPSTGRVRVATCSDRLRDDLLELARSLGWEPYCFTQAPTLSTSGVQGRQPVHYVGFQPTRALPTKLDRKQITRFAKQRRYAVASVVPCAPEKGRCIQVERADGLYLVGRELVPTHNSELASKNFPAWHLGRHPHHEFIACSYNLSLAMGFSRKVKQVMDDRAYRTVFETRIDGNNSSTEEWGVAGQPGGYVAAGIGGPITGKGANCLVIDDPVKNAEEADSADAREKIWEWYLSTAYTRLAPGGGVLLVQTWWHDDDLAGRLQQMMAKADPEDDDVDMFEVVKYPAIATADEYLDTATQEIVHDTPPEGAVKLRSKGEALHPSRYDLKKLNKIRALNRRGDGTDGRWWSALYQQNPVPDDGSYFTKEQFRRGALPEKGRYRVYIAFDFAISEKKQNDYTVGAVGLQDENDVLHVADVLRFKSGDAFYIVESILGLASKWYIPGLVLGFEDGQIYRAISSLLEKRMREKRFYPAVEVLKPITDKMARARDLQGRMQQGMVSFNSDGEWYDVVRQEMLRFPAGVHDDCVDALAWMTKLAIGHAPPRPPAEKRKKSWKDQLLLGGPGSVTHMAA